MSSESTIYYFDIEFHIYNNNKKERKEGGTSGWKTRKETLRNDKNEAGEKKEKTGGNRMLPCVFWRFSFCLK